MSREVKIIRSYGDDNEHNDIDDPDDEENSEQHGSSLA